MRQFLCFSILLATHPVGLRRLMAKAESLAGKSQMNTHSERLWRRGGGQTYRRLIVAIHVVSVIALTMLPSTHVASASEDDDFLLLLIPSIVAANRVELSATSARPGQLLTITGRRFDPDALTTVVFTDQAGNETRVISRSTPTATTVEVSVPFLVNLDTGQVGPGTVSVSVVQERNGGEAVFRAFDTLQIADLPQTGLPPGAITLAFLSSLRTLTGLAAQNYLTIEEASSGTVDTTALRQNLLTTLDNLTAMQTQIQRLVDGAVSQIDIGDIGGQRVFLDRNNLALLDRIYVAYLFNPNFDGTAESVGNQILFLVGVRAPVLIRDLSKRYRAAGGVTLGVAVLLVSPATGLFAPKVATAGAVFVGFGTFFPLLASAALEAASAQALNGTITREDFRITTEILHDVINEAITSRAASLFAGLFGRPGLFANLLRSIISDLKTLIGEVKTTTQDIFQKFDLIQIGLTPPPPEPPPPEPTTAVFTGAFNVTGSFVGSRTDNLGCTFSVNFRGTITITLTVNTSGTVSGPAKVKGSFVSTPTSGCLSTTLSFEINAFVSGTISSITFEGGTVPAVSFTNGSLNNTATAITGTATFTFPGNASGKAATSVTLNKQL